MTSLKIPSSNFIGIHKNNIAFVITYAVSLRKIIEKVNFLRISLSLLYQDIENDLVFLQPIHIIFHEREMSSYYWWILILNWICHVLNLRVLRSDKDDYQQVRYKCWEFEFVYGFHPYWEMLCTLTRCVSDTQNWWKSCPYTHYHQH